MVKVITTPRISLSHMEDFVAATRSPIRHALGNSYALLRDGMNLSDIGTSHRLEILRVLPGIVLPHGPVILEPDHSERPKNAVRIGVPTELGMEAVNINCAARLGNNLWSLTATSSADRANFKRTPPFCGMEEYLEVQHTMLSITWRPLAGRDLPEGSPAIAEEARGMYFAVRLLGGFLNYEKKVFAAADEILIVETEIWGDGGQSGVIALPTGPDPVLSPRGARL